MIKTFRNAHPMLGMRRLVGLMLLAFLLTPAAQVHCKGLGGLGEGLGGWPIAIDTIEGEANGVLHRITDEQLIIAQEDNLVEFPRDQLLKIHFASDDQPSSRTQLANAEFSDSVGQVTLVDGSRCHYTDWHNASSFEGVTFTHALYEQRQLSASLDTIHTWRMPSDSKLSDQKYWQDLVSSSPISDLLVIRRRSNGALKSIEGVIEQVNETGIQFRIGEDSLSVGWERIFGMVFFRPERDTFSGSTVELRDSSSISFDQLSMIENGLFVRTPSGATFQEMLRSIEEIDLSSGKVFSLSDLPLVRSEWDRPIGTPRLLDFTPRLNRSFSDGKLRLAEQDQRLPGVWQTVGYDEGIAIRSNSVLAVSVPEGARWLKGKIGFDPTTRQSGSVEIAILLNSTLLERFTLDGADPPRIIDLALPNDTFSRQLTLMVEPGVNRDAGDNVHFVEARVTK